VTPFILLAPVFWVGFFINGPLFWLPWAGFTGLCLSYQARRRGRFVKDFLLPCWGVFLAVYSVCLYWILSYKFWVYVRAALVLSIFFPLLFLLHHLLTSKVRSKAAEAAAAFGIFFVLEVLFSRIPSLESLGLDFFFQPPVAVLCVMKFVHFKIWSSWVFTTCFVIACWIREKKGKHFVFLGALVGGMAVLVISAHVQNGTFRNATGRTVKIALVQPNLPYSDVWRIEHPEEIKEKYRELVLRAVLGAPDLIVFPLYTLPGDVYREPAFLEELAKTAKRPVLVASHVPIQAGDESFDQGFINLAFLYTPEGKVRDIYQAVETIPFNDMVSKKAEKYRVIRGPFGKLGVLLCYEDIIPRLSREAARDGAGVLVALSNPGLLQETTVPYYQFFQDQIRAAETGLPLIRVSPNGYSALIDRTGTVVQKTKLGVEEILQVNLSGLGPVGTDAGDPQNPLFEEVNRSTR
jgi:apolipoprotein N-acyltransferase